MIARQHDAARTHRIGGHRQIAASPSPYACPPVSQNASTTPKDALSKPSYLTTHTLVCAERTTCHIFARSLK
jgi:hypothetical protein